MEKSRNALQKIKKMMELGIYNRFLKNTENRIRELNRRYSFSEEYISNQARSIINTRLREYKYLSNVLETSFIFSDTPEKQDFWNNIVEELISEI